MSEETKPPNPQEVHKARFGVREDMYFVPRNGAMYSLVDMSQGSFAKVLNNDEQPWSRTYRVTTEWKPLSLGWTGEEGHVPSQIVVMNEEGHFPQVNPTPEEKANALQRMVVLGVGRDPSSIYPFALVPCQKSCRFAPHPDMVIWVVCQHEEAKITVVAVPGD